MNRRNFLKSAAALAASIPGLKAKSQPEFIVDERRPLEFLQRGLFGPTPVPEHPEPWKVKSHAVPIPAKFRKRATATDPE
jgi:hypothetical protein